MIERSANSGAANKNMNTEIPTLSTSLLHRVQTMQPEAWSRMVDVFSPIVYRWGRQAGLSGADAADVVQDVFVAVSQNISRFTRQKEKASFRSWLATIARNRISDIYRRNSRSPQAQGGTTALGMLHNAPTVPEKSQPVSNADLQESVSLFRLNEQLPPQILKIVKSNFDSKTWQAFWDTAVNGDLAVDVAERLGMSVASVYQAKSRILRRLRDRMEELP